MEYSLKLYSSHQRNPEAQPLLTIMEGTMEVIPGSRIGFSYAKVYLDITNSLVENKRYYYDLSYKFAGDIHWQRGAVYTPQPDYPGAAALELLIDQPNPIDGEWMDRTLQYFIGWGLSEV